MTQPSVRTSTVLMIAMFGAATVSRRILFVQTVPALLALASLWLNP